MSNLRKSFARWCRPLLPVLLALAGVWLLIGCTMHFTVPVVHEMIIAESIGVGPFLVAKRNAAYPFFKSGTYDFSDEVGDANSHKRFRPGAMNLSQVVERLGEASLISKDGKSLAYFYVHKVSGTFYPLCFFQILPHKTHGFGLRLDFNEHDMLKNVKMVSVDSECVAYINGLFSVDYGWQFGSLEYLAHELAMARDSTSPAFPATNPVRPLTPITTQPTP